VVPAPGPQERISTAWHSPDHTEHLEQRLKDLATLDAGGTRRWGIILGVAVLLVLGKAFQIFDAQVLVLALTLGTAGAVNLGLSALLRTGWHTRWEVQLVALFDITLVGIPVVFFGPGGLIVGFLLAVLPYMFDRRARVGDVLVLAGSVGYLVAAALHNIWFSAPARSLFALQSTTLTETLAFIAVAMALKHIPLSLTHRIRDLRGVLADVRFGKLGVRSAVSSSDELGFLEQEMNRMLEALGETISQVQHESDEVATFADVLAGHATRLLSASNDTARNAARLAAEMREQRDLADTGRADGTAAAETAAGLRDRSADMEVRAKSLTAAATSGHERVARASETLVALGHDVRSAAETVEDLRTLSERIDQFTQAIGKIARQTRLLALNAAIEAAHAGEHGTGFATVADQVRSLADDASQATRDVADLVGEIRSGVDRVTAVMETGTHRVQDVGSVAEEARAALEELRRGTSETESHVGLATQTARRQADQLASLATILARVAEVSAEASGEADSTARAMASQITAMKALDETGRELAKLSERLRASVSAFSVMRPDQVTTDHQAIRRSRT
jgi:methyl-accepting chemotaxis protein